MNLNSPNVSVILPTYNQAEYLPRALDSVLVQTWNDYELIVVNDGSTDGTRQILDTYSKNYGIKVIHQQNQKLPQALNTGFSQARGKYLTWTSSDNVMLPNMLEVLYNGLESRPEVGLVYSDWQVIDEKSRVIGEVRTFDHDPYILMRTNYVNASFLYRRECQETVGFYDPEYIHAEDWEYWWRISRHFKMMRIPMVLYQYRVHSDSLTRKEVLTKKDSYPIGYERLRKSFLRNPMKWYLSKLIWRWKTWKLKHEMTSYFEFSDKR